MADLSDVTAAIATIVSAAIYPSGTSSPSVSGGPVRIAEGWPIPAQLDADLKAGTAQITIFPMAGNQAATYQPLNRYDTISQIPHGMAAIVSNNQVTLSGTPSANEYCTLIVDGTAYSRSDVTAAAILSELLSDILPHYPSASISGQTLTIPGSHIITARVGTTGVIGWTVHRQRVSIMVTIWASTPSVRTALAAAADIALKQNNHLPMPDTTPAELCYERTNVVDNWETLTLYRRDLIYCAEYNTLAEVPGYEVTSTTITIDDSGSAAPADPVFTHTYN